MPGSINLADVYQIPSAQRPVSDNMAASGPNQGAVVQSRGPAAADTAPAFSLLGLIAALIALRVFIEMGGRVETP